MPRNKVVGNIKAVPSAAAVIRAGSCRENKTKSSQLLIASALEVWFVHWRCASFIGSVPHSLELCFISLYRTCVLVCTLCLHRYLCICLLLGLIHSDLGPPEKKMLPIFCQNVTNFPRLDFFLQKKAVLKLFFPGSLFPRVIIVFSSDLYSAFLGHKLELGKRGE